MKFCQYYARQQDRVGLILNGSRQHNRMRPMGLEPMTNGLKGENNQFRNSLPANKMRANQLAHNSTHITRFYKVCNGFCTEWH